MKPYFTIPVLLLMSLVQPCTGQNVYSSKKEIQKLFKTSIKQESKKKIQIGRNAWNTCNTDSAFFKNDTIVFNNSNSIKCCATVQWTFYRKDSFVQNMTQTCKEPSSATVAKTDDFYTIDFIDDNTSLLLQLSNRIGKRIIYRVVSVDDKSRNITLVRIQQDNL